MSHDDDALIILSVVITPELAECLDRKIGNAFGATREKVAQGFLCRQFSVEPPAELLPGQVPERSAEPVAEGDGPETPETAADDDHK